MESAATWVEIVPTRIPPVDEEEQESSGDQLAVAEEDSKAEEGDLEEDPTTTRESRVSVSTVESWDTRSRIVTRRNKSRIEQTKRLKEKSH